MAAITEYNAELKIWSGPEFISSDPTVSLGQSLLDSLEIHGDKIMQINHNSGYKITAREMRMKALKVAESLTALGIKIGDHVQMCVSEHDDLVPLCVGILVSGAVINTLHSSNSHHEMEYFIELVEPKMIICENEFVDALRKGQISAGNEAPIWTFNKFDDVKVRSVDELWNGYEQESTYTSPNVGDLSEALALIMCTSGTTSMPKAVRISHAMAKYGLVKSWPPQDGQILFSVVPPYYIGWFSCIILSIRLRMVRIFTADRLTMENMLDIIEKRKANVSVMATIHIAQVIELLKKRSYDLSALKLIQMTGSMVSQRTRKEFQEYFEGVTMNVYGMTDASCGIAISDGTNNVFAAGRLLPGVKIKIINEEGQSLSQMETGELCLKIPPTIMGYLKSDNKTNGIFSEDGWFYTGDLGYFDADNELFLVDRKKDILKYQGLHISPSDIEQLVERLTDIDAILVVGITDPTAEGMHLPTALVIKSARNPLITEEEIMKVVEDNMMDGKRLRGGVFFVESLPQTVTGKFQRNKAQAIATELYNQKNGNV